MSFEPEVKVGPDHHVNEERWAMKLLRNMPELKFPEDWLSMFEAEWYANFKLLEDGTIEDYDPEANLVMTPDGASFKNCAENLRADRMVSEDESYRWLIYQRWIDEFEMDFARRSPSRDDRVQRAALRCAAMRHEFSEEESIRFHIKYLKDKLEHIRGDLVAILEDEKGDLVWPAAAKKTKANIQDPWQ